MWFLDFSLRLQNFQVFLHYFVIIIHTYLNCFIIPIYSFSFAGDCSIDSFHKTLSKDNAENNYFSTNYAKNLIKILIKKEKKRIQKSAFTIKWG
jgi:hypothetical protein